MREHHAEATFADERDGVAILFVFRGPKLNGRFAEVEEEMLRLQRVGSEVTVTCHRALLHLSRGGGWMDSIAKKSARGVAERLCVTFAVCARGYITAQ